MPKEYLTKGQFVELVNKLYDILSEAEAEGIITNLDDLITRISELETELKRLTKSEILKEISKILYSWSPKLIRWLREKRYDIGRLVEELAPPTLEEMYAELEERAKKLEEEVKRREVELSEARKRAKMLEKELEKLRSKIPEEKVYVHIEKGYPGSNHYFEFEGFHGRYIGNVCDIIEVDKRDYETSGFKLLLDMGIVRPTSISPEQGKEIRNRIRAILKERGFPQRLIEDSTYNIVRILDYSKSYNEVLREAEARARSVPIPAELPRVNVKEIVKGIVYEEMRRREEYAGIKGASQQWFVYWLRNVKNMHEEEYYKLSDKDKEKIIREWIDWMSKRRGIGMY